MLSEHWIRPWDTLACCWNVKQPTNSNNSEKQQTLKNKTTTTQKKNQVEGLKSEPFISKIPVFGVVDAVFGVFFFWGGGGGEGWGWVGVLLFVGPE